MSPDGWMGYLQTGPFLDHLAVIIIFVAFHICVYSGLEHMDLYFQEVRLTDFSLISCADLVIARSG